MVFLDVGVVDRPRRHQLQRPGFRVSQLAQSRSKASPWDGSNYS
jgi:hypothetical protein